MSAGAERVDVLAAMRRGEAYCYDAGASNAAKALKEARDAVRELIEALGDFDGVTDSNLPSTSPRLRRLRAAFARVQGGES